MTAKRKRHKPDFKAKVALEAFKGDKTINQLASEHEVAAVQVSQWKRQLLLGGAIKSVHQQKSAHKTQM